MAKVTIVLEDSVLVNADGTNNVDVEVEFDPPLQPNATVKDMTSAQVKALASIHQLTATRQ